MVKWKQGSRWVCGIGLIFSGAALGAAYDPGHWNMPVGVTDISREVFARHMLIFWVCVAIGVVVFGFMFYSVFAHRRSRHPRPAHFHESTTVEIIWTIIPFVILVIMAIPAAGTLIKMEDARNSELSVKITGYQWKWHYDYVDQGVNFFSTLHADSNRARQLNSGIDPRSVPNYLLEVDHRLVLPVGKKIRFLLTANDVIHAWWVPDLAVKKDAVPGFINELWTRIERPGLYRGVCAELCGRDHGFMPIVVEAVEPDVFEKWLAAKKTGQDLPVGRGSAAGTQVAAADPVSAAPKEKPVPSVAVPAVKPADLSKDELMKQGENVYNTLCGACHQATGQGLPPTFPALVGSKIVNGPAEAHIRHTLKGKNLMPPFAHLSDADIAAALTYERNAWGHDAGIVQPAAVAAARK
ncbi:MAG: cytochrome c oxidase subunit II [Nevskiales bacterium]|nr:cytochrome c oxidase subunit II [Nevskiales bacterium]